MKPRIVRPFSSSWILNEESSFAETVHLSRLSGHCDR